MNFSYEILCMLEGRSNVGIIMCKPMGISMGGNLPIIGASYKSNFSTDIVDAVSKHRNCNFGRFDVWSDDVSPP